MKIVVYTKHELGFLMRSVKVGFRSLKDYKTYYDLLDKPIETGQLTGWPETKINWYTDRLGIAC